jgi:putative transposase
VFKTEGLRIITTLPRTPRMNATCERIIGTLRRELPDRTLILNERHLALVLREYVNHYNGHRPHQSRQQRPPDIETQPARDVADLRSARRKPCLCRKSHSPRRELVLIGVAMFWFQLGRSWFCPEVLPAA